jgi:hypothetical protein
MRAKLTRADRHRILERGVRIAEASLPSWLTELALSTAYADQEAFTAHIGNTANPHAVTKVQVGLGNVDNTSDVAKPVSTATATALAGKSDTGHGHTFSDISGQVSTAQIPPLAINETFSAADQAAMLALTAQRGDMAIRSDNGRTYVLATDSPATLADWKEVMAAGQVQSVAGKTGVVSLVKADVGLGNIDNTSDLNKPISTAQKDQFIGRGTSTQRDTYYGVPANAAERAALANQKVVWYNTTTNTLEMYFATTGTSGLTVTGIVQTSGWYPEIGSAFRKIVLSTPANHTLIDELAVTRSGGLVTIKGRLNRDSAQNTILPAGAIPVGFRPPDTGALFPPIWVNSAVVMGQVNADGSMITPFSTATGDTMITATWATDPTVLPY